MAHPIDAARRPRWRLAFALPLLLGTLSCALFVRRPLVPMRTVELAEKTGGDCLAVLLPGRYDEPESFRRAGFAEAVERRALKLDLLGVDSHLGYFRDRSIVERLRLDVIQPARAAGYRTIWIVGTSLGGLGGLLYLHEHADDLSGVLALAPYLGDDDVIREIKAAGGPTRWTPPSPLPADQVGRELWSWLGPWAAHPQPTPLHLGWGAGDSLAPANAMLGALLPRERVDTVAGGHDWMTWERLWERFLDRTALCQPER